MAADVNRSGKITGADLLLLRKLILGLITELPGDQNTWRFIDKQIQLDENTLWEVEDGVQVNGLNPGSNNFDFVGLFILKRYIDHNY